VRTGTIAVGGVDRSYTVVVPSGYNPSTPLALVFGWHGSTGTGAGMHSADSGLESAAAGGAIFV
jgi:poly(3-hydroxybutyrate) depolymerase